jgi:predicted lipoprotein with Yx(FWY)xxD motif
MTFALAVFPGSAAAFTGAPIVETDPAVQVAGGFDLKGTVNPYGLDTHYHFEYGTTTSYGTDVPMPEADAGSGIYSVPASQAITGLAANTTYHYRLVATNSEGTAHGVDRSFTTSTNPYAPPPSPEPGAGQNQGGSGSKTVRVKERRIGNRTILTAANGHTLYSLSVEKGGRFVCTKSSECLGIWHPLLIPADSTPKGPVKLGTVERPEGGVQVTFRGRPLYSFAADNKPGQTKGNGLKDVGTWHPATVSTHKRH